MIYLDFLKVKKIMKICSKTHQIAPFKNFLGGSMPPNHLSKRMATPRVASPPPPPPPKKKKNSWPPLANPAFAHELHVLLRNLFENPPWQIVDCVQYVICLCITKSF